MSTVGGKGSDTVLSRYSRIFLGNIGIQATYNAREP